MTFTGLAAMAWVAGAMLVGAALAHVVDQFVWRCCELKRPRSFAPWIRSCGALVFGLAAALRIGSLGGGEVWPAALDERLAQICVDLVFVLLLFALSCVDFAYKLLPDRLTFPGMALGVILSVAVPGAEPRSDALLQSLLGFACGAGVLFSFRWLTTRAFGVETMGLGDVKLLAVIGAFTGPRDVLVALVAGVLVGTVMGLCARLLSSKPHFPFGPSLALGGLAVHFAYPSLQRVGELYLEWSMSLTKSFSILVMVFGACFSLLLVIRVRRRAARIQAEVDADFEELEASAVVNHSVKDSKVSSSAE